MKKNYFTIIELLVVISIIVMLAAMLLPALKKAKDKANEIKCISNLKQFGQASAMYMNDNDGYMPHRYAANTILWYKCFEDYLPIYSAPHTAENYPSKVPNVYTCPSSSGISGGTGTNDSWMPDNWGVPPMSYCINNQLSVPFRFTVFLNPADLIMLADGNSRYFDQFQVDQLKGTLARLAWRHTNRINVLFVPGNVQNTGKIRRRTITYLTEQYY